MKTDQSMRTDHSMKTDQPGELGIISATQYYHGCLDMLKGQWMEIDFQRDPCCTKNMLPVNCDIQKT